VILAQLYAIVDGIHPNTSLLAGNGAGLSGPAILSKSQTEKQAQGNRDADLCSIYQTRFHSGPPHQIFFTNPAIPETRRTLINRGAVDTVEQSFSAVSERQM
jgi:hypothetical protein